MDSWRGWCLDTRWKDCCRHGTNLGYTQKVPFLFLLGNITARVKARKKKVREEKKLTRNHKIPGYGILT
jgi:hypothetical protein